MSWWTDFRDATLKPLGLADGQQAAVTLSGAAASAIGSNNVRQEPPQIQPNPLDPSSWTTKTIAGVSIPVILIAAAGAYFLFKKGK